MARKRAPRLPLFDYVGLHRYFLTIRVDWRRHVFLSAQAVDLTLSHIARAAALEAFAVIAYCFMPDHLHLLAEGTRDDADFRRFVKRLKQSSSFAWKARAGSELWQRGYYEHVLRNDEDTISVARYILNNPVRAGLADRPAAYPFSGSLTMDLEALLGSL